MSGDPFWHVIQSKGLEVPPAVLMLHAGQGEKRYAGRCDITRGTGLLARTVLWLAGFPPAGRNVETQLTIFTRDGRSAWVRDFDAHITRSDLFIEADRDHVVERFGPLRLVLALEADGTALQIAVAHMHFFGLPVPRALLPISATTETASADGLFNFDVTARAPIAGFLIRYRGVLSPGQKA